MNFNSLEINILKYFQLEFCTYFFRCFCVAKPYSHYSFYTIALLKGSFYAYTKSGCYRFVQSKKELQQIRQQNYGPT